jgi:hypothetical protein
MLIFMTRSHCFIFLNFGIICDLIKIKLRNTEKLNKITITSFEIGFLGLKCKVHPQEIGDRILNQFH